MKTTIEAVERQRILNLVGHAMRECRIGNCLTQGEMARRIGVSQSAYSRMESGVTAVSVVQLFQIAAHARVSVWRLLERVMK